MFDPIALRLPAVLLSSSTAFTGIHGYDVAGIWMIFELGFKCYLMVWDCIQVMDLANGNFKEPKKLKEYTQGEGSKQ
ncbi:hypothetical protein QVD17_08789 [Tagetes erecta]|uniref:Uncharacterized protein n=1 Tax=Tagetes erecta TaxID=13708 RepID=A0AAD8KYA3_TARER|nr:hypothetical protein QVD17_08789 [Tagetes erecta]